MGQYVCLGQGGVTLTSGSMFLLDAGLCLLISGSVGLPEAVTGSGGLCLTWGQDLVAAGAWTQLEGYKDPELQADTLIS